VLHTLRSTEASYEKTLYLSHTGFLMWKKYLSSDAVGRAQVTDDVLCSLLNITKLFQVSRSDRFCDQSNPC
jgi:hypothetical protein